MRGEWIEMALDALQHRGSLSLSPCGESGLKSVPCGLWGH